MFAVLAVFELLRAHLIVLVCIISWTKGGEGGHWEGEGGGLIEFI